MERFDAQAEVVHIPTILLRRCASVRSQLSVDADEVDHGGARPEVGEPKMLAQPHDLASEDGAIELDASVQIENAKDDMIDAVYAKGSFPGGSVIRRSRSMAG